MSYRKSLFLLPILFSCATPKKETPREIVKEAARVQEHIVDRDLPECDHCLLGSVGDSVLKKENKEIYYLYGAEHLNLNNYYFDIPVVYNDAVKKWINYFTTRGRDLFRRYAERSGRYAPVLSKILNDQGLPRDLIYLAMAESGFHNGARSYAKAVGPWQFMPYTGKRYGLDINFYIDERRDPLKATVASSMYLRELYERFGSWELAASSYNAGEGKISRAIKIYNTKNFWKLRMGRYLKAETKNYVPKIMALAIIGKNLDAFGFHELEFERALDFEEIEVFGNSDLYKIANLLESDFETIKKYNPELTRWQTPPSEKTYTLRVPVGKKALWSDEKKEMSVANSYKTYTLNGHASLEDVAQKFKVPGDVLETLNDLPKKKKLFPRTVVLLPFREDHNERSEILYADLYEPPRKQVLRRRAFQQNINRAMARGTLISNPREFYTVKKGDTLWGVSQKTGVNINTLIKSNLSIVKKRMILPGDKLAIR